MYLKLFQNLMPATPATQGMITLATYGAGMLIGFWEAGQVSEAYTTPDGHDWRKIWMVPAVIALG
jgi:hypothetical protein